MIFYPDEGELEANPLPERIRILMEAAEHYRAAILDPSTAKVTEKNKKLIPREIPHAYNWEELARLLHEIRDVPEANAASRQTKSDLLNKLAEVYEVLRAAKMPKLEAVRLALINEASHLASATGAG